MPARQAINNLIGFTAAMFIAIINIQQGFILFILIKKLFRLVFAPV
jgi:hypothetical protein